MEAFAALLGMLDGRLPLSQGVGLLGREPVRARFELSPEAVETASEWLHGAGARWGEDPADRERFGLPSERAYSHRLALDRPVRAWA